MLLLPLAGFLFISLLVVAGAMFLSPDGTATIERRLVEVSAARSNAGLDADQDRPMMAMLKRVGAIAPRSVSEVGKLRQRLITAGYRGKEAIGIFFGIRLALAVVSFAVAMTPLVGRPSLPLALAVCAVAYVLPAMVLARLAKRRQHRMRMGLPDALD